METNSMTLVHLFNPHGGPVRTYNDGLLFLTIGVDQKNRNLIYDTQFLKHPL